MIPAWVLSPEPWLFLISALGLWLVPASLGRFTWVVPAAFAALGVYLIAEPELPPVLQPSRSPAIWFLLTLAPLLLLLPDLFARGRAARLIDGIPLRHLLAWSLVHIMGVRHVLSALQGDLGAGLALGIVSGEFFSALGAAALWVWYRPESRVFRFAALFWNVHALVTTLEFALRLMAAHPGMPFFASPSPELFSLFSSWPGSLEALFWVPLLLCLHAALFYKILSPRPTVSSGGFPPGRSP